MIPIGQAYRPEGKLNARSILSATILGVVTALLVAGLVWLWELSSVPTLLLITPLAQGFVIGLVLAGLVGRLRLRHSKLLWTLGFACGLASTGMVHYAHYLHFLDVMGEEYKASILDNDEIPPTQKQELLARLANGTVNAGELVLQLETGHRGLLGSMLFRSQLGIGLKRHQVRGGGVWLLWGIEALAVGLVAASLTRGRTKEPFCGDWCSKQRAPVELMSDAAPTLADAILADDLEGAALALTGPIDIEQHKRDATRVTLHACGHCDQTFASVEGYQIDFDGESTRTTTRSYFKLIRVSPAMAALLRDPPPPATAATNDDRDLAAEDS